MSLRVNQNALALQSYQSLSRNSEGLASSIEKLSTGLRINRGADDAAGLTISERFRQQILGLARAISNAQDGVSMVQTAEGALGESHSILQRMRELAVQAANGTLTGEDRLQIQNEIVQLRDDLNRISNSTEFNTKKLLDGSLNANISSSSNTAQGIVRGPITANGNFRIQVDQIGQGTAQEQSSNIFTLQNSSTQATGNTKLEDIGQFYDSNGTFALLNSETLNISGNGKSTSVQVSRDLTLSQLSDRVQAAITGKLGINNTLVSVNPSSGSTPGALTLQSGLAGQTGEITFSANQALITALGMQETVASADPISRVTRTNSDGTGAITTQTSSNVATGLIDGLDIQFEPVTQAQATGTLQASPGVTISAAVTIRIIDYQGTVATAAFTVAGSYSLDQVASIINSATNTATTRISASVANGQLQLTSADFGTGAYIIISATGASAVTNLHVGLAEGTFTGSGGTTPEIAGTGAVTDFDFSGVGNSATLTLVDRHNVTAIVTLASAFATADGIVSAINSSLISANIQVEAYNSGGVLVLRSKDSGQAAGFSLSIAGGGTAKLKLPSTSVQGTGGTASQPSLQRDSVYAIEGFYVGNDLGADSIDFRITDKNGDVFTAVITSSLSTSLGATFISGSGLVSLINSGLGTAKVDAQAGLTSDNRLQLSSNASGKDTWLLVTDVTTPQSSKSLSQNMGLSSGSVSGSGDSSFTLHIANNQPSFQVGANQGQSMQLNFQSMNSTALGINNLDLTTLNGAQRALSSLDASISRVSSERSKLGSYQNGLEHSINNLRTTYSNAAASESRIRDTDIALEMLNFTKRQILNQTGVAMLAQANLVPNSVMKLLE